MIEKNRRKEMRFSISLQVVAKENGKESTFGLIKDFSRDGFKAVFDDFESSPNSYITLKIQKPKEKFFIPANVEIRWKQYFDKNWEIGFKFKDFVPQVKAEILEYCYSSWLKEKVYA